MKRLVIVVAAGLFACVVAFVGLHLWWLHSAPPEERRSLVWPGGISGSSAGPIKVELAPELAAAGVSCEFLGVTQEGSGIFFLKVEKAAARLKLVTTHEPLNGGGLVYSLFDKGGRRLGDGQLSLGANLGAHESREISIRDVRTQGAWRIVISRETVK